MRRSGDLGSRASSQMSAAKRGMAKVCARAVDGTIRSITGLATAAIQVDAPPRARAANIAISSAASRQAVSTSDTSGRPPSE